MRFLIQTIDDDVHALTVAKVLRAQGHQVQTWQLDWFPTQASLSYRSGGGQILAGLAHERIDLDAPDVVWNRRCAGFKVPDAVAPADRDFARQELRALQKAIWAMTGSNAFWVNAEPAALACNHKPLQLRLAERLGLMIPETLISNDPASVRDFVATHAGQCIYKPLGPADWQESGRWHIAYTSAVRAEDLPGDALLAACPGIYQRKIEKRAEVRATFMGASSVALQIDSQQTNRGQLDWRRAQSFERMPVTPIELPAEVEARCLAMMRELGIVFGCFDFIIDQEGRYVFLEVNEAGQFLFLESWCPELPVLDMFCQFLCAAEAGFRYSPGRQVLKFHELVAAV